MTKIQLIGLTIGMVLALCAMLYVPWNYVDADGRRHPVGYGLFWSPPALDREHQTTVLGFKIEVDLGQVKANEVDLKQVAFEVAIIGFFTSGVVWLGRRWQ